MLCRCRGTSWVNWALYSSDIKKEKGWKSKLGFGGSKYMVQMLEEGVPWSMALDAQAFDL